jgi:hypothetical protein
MHMEIDERKQLTINVLFGYDIPSLEESLSRVVSARGINSKIHLFGETTYHHLVGGVSLRDNTSKAIKKEVYQLEEDDKDAEDVEEDAEDVEPPKDDSRYFVIQAEKRTKAQTRFDRKKAESLERARRKAEKQIAKEMRQQERSTMSVTFERKRRKMINILDRITSIIGGGNASET